MNKIQKYASEEKATVCSGNNCVTIYGDAAKVVSALVSAAVLMILVALVAKAISK